MNTINQDMAARWENVAQAAKWIAEGRDVEVRAPNCTQWQDLDGENERFPIALSPVCEYRLK